MRFPPVDLAAHRDTVEFTGWRGKKVAVFPLYDRLTKRGWKIDTEESNLMNALSKTWREEGIKVWVSLKQFVTAPPDGEIERLDKICFYRFDPAKMPSGTMYDRIYKPGDEEKDWYPAHREEWEWLIDHGDPQFATFDLLQPIPFREVPPAILRAAWTDLEEALELVR